MDPTNKWWEKSYENAADVPDAPEIAKFAIQYPQVRVKLATQIVYHGEAAHDSMGGFLKELAAKTLQLLPDNYVVHTNYLSQPRDWQSHRQQAERSEALPGWSILFINRCVTEAQVVSIAPKIVAAASDYDQLTTSLMTRLAVHFDDTPRASLSTNGLFRRVAVLVPWH